MRFEDLPTDVQANVASFLYRQEFALKWRLLNRHFSTDKIAAGYTRDDSNDDDTINRYRVVHRVQSTRYKHLHKTIHLHEAITELDIIDNKHPDRYLYPDRAASIAAAVEKDQTFALALCHSVVTTSLRSLRVPGVSTYAALARIGACTNLTRLQCRIDPDMCRYPYHSLCLGRDMSTLAASVSNRN
jgi:hypothetical protein